MKFNVGCKVTFKASTPLYTDLMGRVGEISNIHPDLEIAVIKFSDENRIVKARYDWIESVSEESNTPDGAKTITKTEFLEAVMEATMPHRYTPDGVSKVNLHVMVMAMSAFTAMTTAADRIFIDGEPITVTCDEFLNMLWDEISPNSIAKSLDETNTARKCLAISMAVLPALTTIIDDLFSDPDSDD